MSKKKKRSNRQFWRMDGPALKLVNFSLSGLQDARLLDISYGGLALQWQGQKEDLPTGKADLELQIVDLKILFPAEFRYHRDNRLGLSFLHSDLHGFRTLKDTIGYWRIGKTSEEAANNNVSGSRVFSGEGPWFLRLASSEKDALGMEGVLSFMDDDGRYSQVVFDSKTVMTGRVIHNKPLLAAGVLSAEMHPDILRKALFLIFGILEKQPDLQEKFMALGTLWSQKLGVSIQLMDETTIAS